MKYDLKTLLRMAAGAAIVLGAVYVALPVARPYVLTFGPLLLLLICPVWIRFMMNAMKRSGEDGEDGEAAIESEASGHDKK